jgi:DNA helicase-2/ATP-dependent DNA helicase PcrA
MTSRIGQPDTQADIDLRACLDERPQTSFVMVAGAGSGKTTSLVKALAHLEQTRNKDLRTRGQRIACVTYTEVAVKEIWGDVGNDSLFHVSTIHSFLWSVIRPFQLDIRDWVLARIDEKIGEAQARLANPRTRPQTRAGLESDIERYRRQHDTVGGLTRFTYGTGSDFGEGILGHADVIAAVPELIEQSQLLRNIIASRFPFIFVDESQDTVPTFVAALRRIAETVQQEFCLGFFGDPMQKIYTTGAGPILLGEQWREVTKPENFRCPRRVLQVVNAIRAGDDGLDQTRGRMIEVDGQWTTVEGTARLFLLPADERRSARIHQVRQWLSRANNDPHWMSDDRKADVRALVVVHRMAATRLGFPNLYSALNDRAPPSLKNGLEDGSAWPLRPFLTYLLPIVLALRADEHFQVLSLLRSECPLLSKDGIVGRNVSEVLRQLNGATVRLDELLQAPTTSIRQVLHFAVTNDLLRPDDRYTPYLADPDRVADPDDSESGPVIAFLACRVEELWGYRSYIEDMSPFATQQGVKGAEFARVMVIIDDDEGRAQTLFSYGKYFGITPLSDTDRENLAEGTDSVLGRTRRLFYVCCSRALQDLAVVMFLPDVGAVRRQIEAKGLFRREDIYDEAALIQGAEGVL